MWRLIGSMAVLGLSANEPSALLVVLVVLRSGRTRGVAFVCGWIAALIVVVAGAGFLIRLGLGARPGGPRRITLVVEIVIGIALIAWSVWYWFHTRGRERSIEVPKYLARLTSIGLTPALFAGVVACTYPPAIVAGTTLFRSDASVGGRVAGLATFVIVGTLMVALPVVGSYAAPEWAARRSNGLFNWTLHHRRTLLVTILIAVGVFISVRAVVLLIGRYS